MPIAIAARPPTTPPTIGAILVDFLWGARSEVGVDEPAADDVVDGEKSRVEVGAETGRAD
jgi:hypothetical protein